MPIPAAGCRLMEVPAAAVPEALLDASKATYTAQYCEENVWWLMRAAAGSGDAAAYAAVFVSNERRAVAISGQRAASPPGGTVVWDYHVVAVRLPAAGRRPLVLDLDSTVGYPADAAEYARRSFPPVREAFRRRYRLVPAATYLAEFASDRSHMRAAAGAGGWLAPPPPYAPIRTDRSQNCLDSFIDTAAGRGPGRAMDEAAFLDVLLGAGGDGGGGGGTEPPPQ